MTNAEKFEEVYGFKPTKLGCPVVHTLDCLNCKGYNSDFPLGCSDSDWWNSEYKEN